MAIVVFIFLLRFLYFVSGQTTNFPSIICSFSGKTDYRLVHNYSTPPFGVEKNDEVDKMPQECKAMLYGHYYLDKNNTWLYPEDKEGAETLKATGKTVYVRVTFRNIPQWFAIANSMTEESGGPEYTEFIDQMIRNYIAPFKIDGVILDALGLFEAGDNVQPDYATKMVYLVNQMKRDVPNLIVGLVVNANQNHLFGRADLFHFDTANKAVDIYVIDMENNDIGCNADTAQRGRFSIKGGNMSLEAVNTAVANSKMDKKKTMINLIIKVSINLDSKTELRTYKEYCVLNKSTGSSIIWCRDTFQMCQDKTAATRPVYAGMMLSYLDYDDYDGSCLCDNGVSFPVARAFIAGWNSLKITPCPGIG